MKALGVVFVLLLVGMACLGFYRGWFSLSATSSDHKPSATITVDNDKIQEDEQTAKDKVHDFGQGAKKKAGELTDKAKAPNRRP